ncbi:MAG TPA: hypothetical protein VMD91_03840 [Candidatus Sulfotelmatobacter sp.]|nr:hypothetical protein [Candidatus Sulfotelmatobacter sp.]
MSHLATRGAKSRTLRFGQPATRPLKVYAFDPSLGKTLGNFLVIDVRYEKLEPGPLGERFAVVDYDGSTKGYYTPVDLDEPDLLLGQGLDPTEADPRFHQQMVYAVASETLDRFEAALGRRVHWRLPKGKQERRGVLNRLYLFPHAMVQANAFYSPDVHGILFGYFRASDYADAQVVPGETIFTCLSHDIIAHEVTHAVVDGIRQYFMEATNIDVPAFHEAFADMSALFRHFSHSEVLLDTLQRTGGKLYLGRETADTTDQAQSSSPLATRTPTIQAQVRPDNPLIELARQFGQVSGMHNGLRSALGIPQTPDAIRTTTEPHLRGAILVAAVFDAYFDVYLRQTADLFRIFRAGGGSAHPVDLPGPLAALLANAASDIADLFFSVCARALDYCPPVDVTFGDFLRALITADTVLFPSDTYGVRESVMQAFRARGILPTDAEFFSEDALCWPRVAPGTYDPVVGLEFGDPNGLTTEEKNANAAVLHRFAKRYARDLGFDPKLAIEIPSFHPMFRTDEDGSLKVDMVVEMVQVHNEPLDPKQPNLGSFPLRCGVTMIIARPPVVADERKDPQVSFVIEKSLSDERRIRQRAAYAEQGVTDGPAHVNLALLHGI